MSIGTTIYTWLYGKIVATDEIGNKYYTNSENHNDLKAKRWVIFKGEIEASKIPLIGMHGFINLLMNHLLIIRININGRKIINQT